MHQHTSWRWSEQASCEINKHHMQIQFHTNLYLVPEHDTYQITKADLVSHKGSSNHEFMLIFLLLMPIAEQRHFL
uniref:Uncharacterized protein n=1 Tax=Arundo donax TaxID=35708 RepID=A0A0A9DC12_ARUDO